MKTSEAKWADALEFVIRCQGDQLISRQPYQLSSLANQVVSGKSSGKAMKDLITMEKQNKRHTIMNNIRAKNTYTHNIQAINSHSCTQYTNKRTID